MVDGSEIKIKDWKERIESLFNIWHSHRGEDYDEWKIDNYGYKLFAGYLSSAFLDEIFSMSLKAFDIDREVQVVIDSNERLFISYGTPGFVSFENQEEQLKQMKLPIKCWIHTHPFGTAYFSGTDRKTINSWKLLMESAIVLGDRQRMLWMQDDKTLQNFIFYEERMAYVGEEE